MSHHHNVASGVRVFCDFRGNHERPTGQVGTVSMQLICKIDTGQRDPARLGVLFNLNAHTDNLSKLR